MINSAKKEIGQRLRAFRKSRGVTGNELAQRMNYSQSGISKIENGKLKPSIDFIKDFCTALDLDKKEAQELEDLTEFFRIEYDRWTLDEEGHTDRARSMISNPLQRVTHYRIFKWTAIPGLLGTRAYAYALLPSMGCQPGPDLDHAVNVRMRRQKYLFKKKKHFHFILSEYALTTRICPASVMQEQLDHLCDCALNETFTFKILPKETQLSRMPMSNFVIHDNRYVLIDTQVMDTYLWRQSDLQVFMELFRALDEISVARKDAVKIIKNAAKLL